MFKKIQQWYEGKNVRVDSDEPDNIGGMGVLHDTEKEYHWSAKIAHRLVSFYIQEWKWILGVILAVVTLLINKLI